MAEERDKKDKIIGEKYNKASPRVSPHTDGVAGEEKIRKKRWRD
jgi:hypothetical protein